MNLPLFVTAQANGDAHLFGAYFTPYWQPLLTQKIDHVDPIWRRGQGG
ncbi:MAG: hypothetical protein ACRC5V_07560 [Aeromonas sp.]